MKFYCLSNNPNKPCYVLTMNEMTVMLDCGLSTQTALNFIPLSFVPTKRLEKLSHWMPQDVHDPDLEGELKECNDKVFVDSQPEFCPPLDKLVDFSGVDVILISNYLCMMALPYITEGTGFQGTVYATEPTLQIGRLFLEELVEYIEQCPTSKKASLWKQFLHKLPSPLAESFKPKSWKQIYSKADLNASLARVQMVGYNEKIDVFGALKVIPVSSGFCLGSSNWIIHNEYEKIVYVSGSSTLTTHPKPMEQAALRNADIVIMSGLTQTPVSNPDAMLGMLCMVVAMTVRNGGNVLIPCYPSGVVYDLFECLSTNLDNSGLQSIPMFFLSPVADTSLAYSNILAEWLSSVKQNKVYIPEEPFPHAALVKTGRLKHFKHIYSDGFSTDFREPCIVFCGHPSLRFGDAVHFIEMWGSGPKNTIIFTEPDFDYVEALAPFQPLQMKTAQCAIDTSLNFSQANKLIKDLKPGCLIIPDCYTQPPITAPQRMDLVIEQQPEKMLLTFKRGHFIRLPKKRKYNQVLIEPHIADNVIPTEIKPGVMVSSLTTVLEVKDSVHTMESAVTATTAKIKKSSKPDELQNIQYEWGRVNIKEFLEKIAQEGLSDPKVESSPSGIIIHFQEEDTLIQIDEHSTHVVCDGDPSVRDIIRNSLLNCIKKF